MHSVCQPAQLTVVDVVSGVGLSHGVDLTSTSKGLAKVLAAGARVRHADRAEVVVRGGG